MAIQLSLQTKATSLVDLQSNGHAVLDDFNPGAPSDDTSEVVDQARILIRDTAGSTVDQKITAINNALNLAKIYYKSANQVYLHYAKNATDTAQRSLVSGGSVAIERRWRRDSKAIINVFIQRAPWWEGAETQVPLTNANGTNDTSGLTVWNHDDAGTGHDNYVQIAAADVAGDLPGATRLELTNTYASDRLYCVYIGQSWTDPANHVHILEGEDSTAGSDVSNATCSGAYYNRVALASGAEADLQIWTLSAAMLNACKGSFYKLLVRLPNASAAPLTDVRFRLKLQYTSNTTIWQSGQISFDTNRAYALRDMFTLRLPPWLPQQTGLAALTMVLTGQQSTGSSINVDIDFIMITPVDGWRFLEPIGYGVAQNSRILDDGIYSDLYVDDGSATGKVGIYVGYGSPIMLMPGKLQRLYFLMHANGSYTAEIARTISVKLYYRPRRRTI